MDYETTRHIVLEILQENCHVPNFNLQFADMIHKVQEHTIFKKIYSRIQYAGFYRYAKVI